MLHSLFLTERSPYLALYLRPLILPEAPPANEHLVPLLNPFEFPRPFVTFVGCPFLTQASKNEPTNTFFWLKQKLFVTFVGWGCFEETLANNDWIASWGELCPFGHNKTFVNSDWIAFWGVLYPLGNNTTIVNSDWNALGVSHCRCDLSSAHYFVCVCVDFRGLSV